MYVLLCPNKAKQVLNLFTIKIILANQYRINRAQHSINYFIPYFKVHLLAILQRLSTHLPRRSARSQVKASPFCATNAAQALKHKTATQPKWL